MTFNSTPHVQTICFSNISLNRSNRVFITNSRYKAILLQDNTWLSSIVYIKHPLNSSCGYEFFSIYLSSYCECTDLLGSRKCVSGIVMFSLIVNDICKSFGAEIFFADDKFISTFLESLKSCPYLKSA